MAERSARGPRREPRMPRAFEPATRPPARFHQQTANPLGTGRPCIGSRVGGNGGSFHFRPRPTTPCRAESPLRLRAARCRRGACPRRDSCYRSPVSRGVAAPRPDDPGPPPDPARSGRKPGARARREAALLAGRRRARLPRPPRRACDAPPRSRQITARRLCREECARTEYADVPHLPRPRQRDRRVGRGVAGPKSEPGILVPP